MARPSLSSGSLILALLLALSCGTEPASTPHIDFSDYKPWEDPGDAQGDARIGLDGEAPDGEAPDGDGPGDGAGDLAADLPPEVVEPICVPGMVKCKMSKVQQCNEVGTGYDVLDDCDDGNECTEDDCVNGVCTHAAATGSCCDPPCEIGHLCINSECICLPNCLGKECGDDGCGGSCGECEAGFACSQGGKCKCQPDCSGKDCGDDGCGGDCGICLPPLFCDAGSCACIPDCTGKVCGDDGCGGSCGGCPALHKCDGSQCFYSCSICPDMAGCLSVPYAGHAYYFCTYGKSWNGARDECTKNQAHLVTIGSAEENVFLTLSGGGGTYWIGYYQEWYTWVWSWVNDEPKSFESWDNDQPDNGGFWPPDEDCVELKGNGKWNDQECGTDRHFICEFEPPS
jgi:hypothetical protein